MERLDLGGTTVPPILASAGCEIVSDGEAGTVRGFVRTRLDAARTLGVEITYGTDFQEFLELCRSATGKDDPHPVFQPDGRGELSSESGFWLVGRWRGRTVHLGAIRRFALSEPTLAGAFPGWPDLYGDPPRAGASGTSYHCAAKSAHRITGVVCYLGEVWHSPEFRGRGLSRAIPPIALALAYIRWRPDYVIAVVEPWVVRSGVARQYGMLHNEPGLITAESGGECRTIPDWLIWLSGRELFGLVSDGGKPAS